MRVLYDTHENYRSIQKFVPLMYVLYVPKVVQIITTYSIFFLQFYDNSLKLTCDDYFFSMVDVNSKTI